MAAASLDGSVAVVVGAGAGIGREIALALGAEGATVVLAGRSTEAMAEVAAGLRDGGGTALVVELDLRSEDSVTAAAERVLGELGRVDVLVCNSGVPGPSRALTEITTAEWADTLAVNVTGVFLACRAFLPAMTAAGTGSVVVIGSVTGKRPMAHRSPYATSKAALIGLVRTLATEVGPSGVRVNLVSPGAVEGPRLDWVVEQRAAADGVSADEARAALTDVAPQRRAVTAREVADAVVFLASPRAGGTTGEDVNVAAGAVMY